MHRIFHVSVCSLFLTLSAVSGIGSLQAQDRFRVQRIRTIPDDLPILNIHVDEDNVKWVANTQTLYKIESKDQATEVPLAGEVSLLQFPGGNADIRWKKEAMQQQLGYGQITAASYDKTQKILWVGTNGYGLFKFRVNPGLQLIEQLHIDNSKLRSDFINSIFVANNGKVWVATEDGAVAVDGNQWTIHQKFFNILRIRGRGNELWAIGDDLIWLIDRKENWSPIAVNRREIEAQIHDIAVDKEGRVWIASNIMTAYRVDSDRYQRFGPGQYFTSQFVNFVAEDDDATIWVGTNDKGLYIIEKESTITVTPTIESYLPCEAGATGAVVAIKAIGGKPPYTVTWEHGVTGERLTDLAAGSYQLTVTDQDGSSKAAAIEIPDPSIRLTASVDRPESGIGQADGAASVQVSGGVEPYHYAWSSGAGTASITALSEGEYGVTVTDAAGCSTSTSIMITQILQPLAVMVEQKQPINCPGDATAVVVAKPSGGKPPYRYTWSDGNDGNDVRDGLMAGTYQVTVTDAAQTSASATFMITEPEALAAAIEVENPASANAEDGRAVIQVKGGKAPYTYRWDNQESSKTAAQLGPGLHTATVTDASGCTAEASADISENILALSVSIERQGEIRCAGDETAALTVSHRGGKSPFSYAWNIQGFSGTEVNGLGIGDYQVTVTDVAGTTATAAISITGPGPIQATVAAEGPALAGKPEGKAVVRAEGGTGKLSYLWDHGETGSRSTTLNAGMHQVTITDAAGCSAIAEVEIVEHVLPLNATLTREGELKCAGDRQASLIANLTGGKQPYQYLWSGGETEQKIANLGAGTYGVTITDAEGTSVNVSQTITEPAAIAVSTRAEAPALAGQNDGVATVTAEGGTGRLEYLWDTGLNKTRATGLGPGVHIVTVTDANGCSATAEVTIAEDFLPLSANLSVGQAIQCAHAPGGAISVAISGGKEPYQLTWDNDLPGIANPQDLGPGTYHVTITDAAGSSLEKSITLNAPEALVAEAEVMASANANQNDGQARVRARGGTIPYRYSWSHSETTESVKNLGAGDYQVTVTDGNGCTAVATVLITEDILPLNITLTQSTPIRCAGDSGAAIEATIQGGKSPFTFKWDDQSELQNRTGLGKGQYSVEVTDASGQKARASIAITEPEPLTGEMIDVRAATHARIQDGRATAKVKGGTTPYAFTWDNGESGAKAVALSTGIHNVSITDAHGCTLTLNAQINEKILPELTATNLEKGEAVRMEKLLFAADSSSIDETSIPTLEELYQFLYDNPTIVVEIGGHTNSLPADEYCDRLSTERAKAVADYIIDKGIEAKRILYKGYGKRQPIATNMTPEGRKRNQRVEVKIVKLSE